MKVAVVADSRGRGLESLLRRLAPEHEFCVCFSPGKGYIEAMRRALSAIQFSGLYMVMPVMAIIMLFVFIMQFIIRMWMANSPRYVRKSVRFPLNEALTDYIMSTMYRKGEGPGAGGRAGIPHGYRPKPPPPVYKAEEAYAETHVVQQQRFGSGGQYAHKAPRD